MSYMWSAYSSCFYITHNDAPQSVEPLWTSDQLVAENSTWQHTTLTTDQYPCPRWDSNPRSQQASGLQPLTCWDRGFESHWGHGYLPVVSVVVCDLEISRIGAPYIYIYIHTHTHTHIYDISSLRVNQLLYYVSLKIYNKFANYFVNWNFQEILTKDPSSA
jgi:hypothetical protein